jgi:alpha-tubulin suppressor-like RCC1 family protein
MKDLIIEKISCGSSHSLLLSNEGIIYGLGKYFSRKLDFRLTEPLKLNHSKKFIEIATHWSQDFSVALSEEGLYNICDKFETNGEINSKETSFQSFNEIFIKYLQIT